MKKKLFNIYRQTMTDVSEADIKHEKKVEMESQLRMANAKKRWLIDY